MASETRKVEPSQGFLESVGYWDKDEIEDPLEKAWKSFSKHLHQPDLSECSLEHHTVYRSQDR